MISKENPMVELRGEVMITAEIWQQGKSIGDYVNMMSKFQKEMRTRLRDTRITPSECQRLRVYPNERKILVFTEEGCEDSLMNLPVLIKMADCNPILDIKIFERSNFPTLNNLLITKGYSKIPLFFIMQADFEFINCWMERPKNAYRRINQWMQSHPDFRKVESENDNQEYEILKANFINEMWNWYDTELQSETVKEVLSALD